MIRPILPFKASFVDSHITMFQCGQFDHEILRVQVTKRQDLDDWRFPTICSPLNRKVFFGSLKVFFKLKTILKLEKKCDLIKMVNIQCLTKAIIFELIYS